jgi:hypothetical protein
MLGVCAACAQNYFVDAQGLDVPFLKACIDAGALAFWDAVTLHPYMPWSPEQGEAEVAHARALIAARAPLGRSIPVLCGEMGYSTAVNQTPGYVGQRTGSLSGTAGYRYTGL